VQDAVLFWQEVGRLRPDLDRAFNPGDDLVTPDALGSLLRPGTRLSRDRSAGSRDHIQSIPVLIARWRARGRPRQAIGDPATVHSTEGRIGPLGPIIVSALFGVSVVIARFSQCL
jgi:hypothetical protein